MSEISIVLPTYNGERFIRESIESILYQSFSDLELIIVNDHSTDSTARIIEEYERNDKRIRVIHNAENQKLPKSLNIGFSIATGKYLTWTSDDNVYESDALSSMWGFMKEHEEYPMVVADMMIDDQSTGTKYVRKYDASKIYIHNSIGACFLYKREITKTIGEYDEDLFLVEDYDYWLRILFHYGCIGHINRVLYHYRINEYSLTGTRLENIKRKRIYLLARYFEKIIERIKEQQELLLELYLGLRKENLLTEEKERIFYTFIPELECDKKFKDEKKYIIFGAGFWGKKAQQEYAGKVTYFADNNIKKVGQMINGVPVISVPEMVSKKEGYHILLAVGCDKLYDLIKEMRNAEIKEYSIYCCVL